MGRYSDDGLKLSDVEIASAFKAEGGSDFPPILDVELAARLARVSEKTVYDWSYRGLLEQCAVRRGKRLRIFRDRFVRFLFGKVNP